MSQKSEDINGFWKEFHQAGVDSGVAEPIAIWYVNRAQKFATSLREKSLRPRSVEDVFSVRTKITPWCNFGTILVPQSGIGLIEST